MAVRIVTGSDDGTAKVWDVSDAGHSTKGVHLATLANGSAGSERWLGHTCGITSLDFLDDHGQGEQQVVTASKDKEVKVWSLHESAGTRSDWRLKRTFPMPENTTDNEESRLHRKRYPFQRRLERTYKRLGATDDHDGANEEGDQGHLKKVNHAQFFHDGETKGKGCRVLSCSDDAQAIIWDVSTGRKVTTLYSRVAFHRQPIVMGQVSRAAGPLRVLTCSLDRTCMVWDARAGTCIKQIPAPRKEGEPRQPAGDPSANAGPIWSAAFSRNGDMILTASADGYVKVWDVSTARCIVRAGPPMRVGSTDVKYARPVRAVWNPHAQGIAMSCHMDGSIQIYDFREPLASSAVKTADVAPAQSAKPHDACVWQASYGSKENHVITASHDMTAQILDTRNLKNPLFTLEGHTGILWGATFSDHDRWAMTYSEDHTAKVWNMASGGHIPHHCTLAEDGHNTTHTLAVTCAAFSDCS